MRTSLVLKTPRIMFVNAALGLLAVTLTASGCGNKNAASVEDGKDYTFTAGTCRGPDYATVTPGAAPGDAVLDCLIHADKPRYQMLVTFQMKGDGSLLPQQNAGTTLKVN